MANKTLVQVLVVVITMAITVALFVIKQWVKSDRATDAKLDKLSAQFSQGQSSQDFLTATRREGATDFSVVPSSSKEAWLASEFGAGGLAGMEKDFVGLNEKFQKLEGGNAIARFKLHFGKHPKGLAIDFKDGRVTVSRIVD